jgi:hypothetical protein
MSLKNLGVVMKTMQESGWGYKLLLIGLTISFLSFLGCKTTEKIVEVPVETRVEVPVEKIVEVEKIVYVDRPVEDEQGTVRNQESSTTTLQPFTTDRLLQAINSGTSYKNFQYYISEAIVLKDSRTGIRINSGNLGEFEVRDASSSEEVEILEETGGEARDLFSKKNKPQILSISFDESTDALLTFVENTEDHLFELQYEEGEGNNTIKYGGKEYNLEFEEVPHLLIKEDVLSTENPAKKILPGRAIKTGVDDATAPLESFTKDKILQAIDSGTSYKNFQYYISGPITLDNNKTAKRISASVTGDYVVRNTSSSEEIELSKETKGEAIELDSKKNKPWVLSVYFDETSTSQLLFVEDPADQLFKLQYNKGEEGKTVNFDGKTYYVSFDETPYLLVRKTEVSTDTPARKTIPGRFLK